MKASSETCEHALLTTTLPIACNTRHLMVIAFHPLLQACRCFLGQMHVVDHLLHFATDCGSFKAQVWKHAFVELYFTLVLVTACGRQPQLYSTCDCNGVIEAAMLQGLGLYGC